MFIREMSDIHLEICAFFVPPMVGDEDTVLILSGDICTAKALGSVVKDFFESTKRFKAVIYVPGNHEYYRDHLEKADDKIRAWLTENEFTNVHLLNGNSVVIDDVAFVGATLWTDMNKGNPISRIDVENGLNDYRVIRTAGYRRIRSNDTIVKHLVQKAYLFEEVANLRPTVRRTVVVSHHAPSELSVHQKYKGNSLNAGYYSNMEYDVMDKGPDIWTHGHMHDTFQYDLGATTVICNPRGYSQTLNPMYRTSMRKMDPLDLNDIKSFEIIERFNRIWYTENEAFNPFFRFQI